LGAVAVNPLVLIWKLARMDILTMRVVVTKPVTYQKVV